MYFGTGGEGGSAAATRLNVCTWAGLGVCRSLVVARRGGIGVGNAGGLAGGWEWAAAMGGAGWCRTTSTMCVEGLCMLGTCARVRVKAMMSTCGGVAALGWVGSSPERKRKRGRQVLWGRVVLVVVVGGGGDGADIVRGGSRI